MTSANDLLKIFQNILAQSPEGLSDPNLIGKFAKAKAFLHAQQSMEQMNNSPMMPNQSVTAPISAPVDTSTPLGQNLPQDAQSQSSAQGQSQPQPQPQLGKYDNL
jgi:hypothetical protein